MPATARAASAATAILIALGSPASAVEEKSTKPRLAVLELTNKAEAKLQVDAVSWGQWIADVERPQAAGRGVDIARVDGEIVNPSTAAGKQPKTRTLGLAPGGTRPRPAANEEKGGTEDINIGVGELQEGPGGDPDRPVIAGRVPNPRDPASAPETGDEILVGMEHGDPGSGQATGRGQHKPITITKEWGAATPQLMKPGRPAARGSVWIRTSQPWTSCRVGARFPSAEIDGYRLRNLTVSSCPGTSAAEGVTLAYEGFNRVR